MNSTLVNSITDDDILLEELEETNFHYIIEPIILFLKDEPKSFDTIIKHLSIHSKSNILQALDISIKLNKIKISKKANRLLGDQLYSLK